MILGGLNPLSLTLTCISVLLLILLYFIQAIYQIVLKPRWHLRNVAGPSQDFASFFSGHMDTIDLMPAGEQHAAWHDRYGSIFVYDGYFKIPRISVIDPLALKYILQTEALSFPKPPHLRRMLAQVAGSEGLLVAEGEEHTRQRRILAPAFNPSSIRKVFPVLMGETRHLRDVILDKISDPKGTVLDAYHYSSRASLDFIGATGFGYDMGSIEHGHGNELAKAFYVLTNAVANFDLMHVLVNIWPILLRVDYTKRARGVAEAEGVMMRIGTELMEERKRATLVDGTTEAATTGLMDLLSVLVKANMSKHLQPSQKLSDPTLMSQIKTFLLAGDGSVAASISWALFLMAKHPEMQVILRGEISSISSQDPSWDQLNALPYLDSVMRETFRLYPAFSGTLRVANTDSFIPLEKPIRGRNGTLSRELFVAKGTGVFVPYHTLNHSTENWGVNASEFDPERWLRKDGVPEGSKIIPSSDYMPFSIGPHHCIGFRLAIMELKVVLFMLIRSIKFELATPADDIVPIATFLTRPRLKTRWNDAFQLPLKLIPLQRSEYE